MDTIEPGVSETKKVYIVQSLLPADAEGPAMWVSSPELDKADDAKTRVEHLRARVNTSYSTHRIIEKAVTVSYTQLDF